MITVHTSPLEQPGMGDAGGMNVYIDQVARQLAAAGVEVEIYTRATTGALPPVVDLADGVRVHHVVAGPYEGLGKADLPGQLCAFAAGVMREAAAWPEGWADVLHSHYWLSGQVGWLAADRWGVPLVHTMHTMARVKNQTLRGDDSPEPAGREIGELQVVEAADRLVANTEQEARELVELYDADPAKVRVVHPGVDLDTFVPGDQAAARAAVGVPSDARVLLFVGRIQPLKAPDVLLRVAAELLRRHRGNEEWRGRLLVGILGGPSGTGLTRPEELHDLASELRLDGHVRFVPPCEREVLAQWYRAADVVVVPSRSESFGLVALEAQACGTPVVAAEVGGLPVAVGDAGVLVDGYDVGDWADAVGALLEDDARRRELGRLGVAHAAKFGWGSTANQLMEVYGEARESRLVAPPPAQGLALAGVPQAQVP